MEEVNSHEDELVGRGLTRRDRLMRDAEDLADRFEDEFGGTFLDPVISMIRQLVKEIQILDQAQA